MATKGVESMAISLDSKIRSWLKKNSISSGTTGRRCTQLLKDALEADPEMNLDEFRSKANMRKLYLRAWSMPKHNWGHNFGHSSHSAADVLKKNVPICACGNDLDMSSSAYNFGLNKQARSITRAPAVAASQCSLMNHNPMVLKIYFDYCKQLCVRPNSGFEGLLSRGSVVGLDCFCALRELNLRYCCINDDALVPIVRLLALAKDLEVLDVSENLISDAGVTLLIEMACSQQSFTTLNLENNHKVSMRSFRPLLRMLQNTTRMTMLVLEGTTLSKDEKNVLYYQMLWNRRKVLHGAVGGCTSASSSPIRPVARSSTESSISKTYESTNALPELVSLDGQPTSVTLLPKPPAARTGSSRPTVRLKKEVQHIEKLMDRFKLLTATVDDNNNSQWANGEQLLKDPLYPGPPDSLDEDCWDRQQSFEAAQQLYRLWRKERNVLKQEDADKELALQRRRAREKSRDVIAKWALFVELVGMNKKDDELELWRMLRSDLPKTREELEIAIKKLQGLIKQMQARKSNFELDLELEAAAERLIMLQDNFASLNKRMKLFKACAHASKFVNMNKKQIEEAINKRLLAAGQIHPSVAYRSMDGIVRSQRPQGLLDMSDDELQTLADELQSLVERGEKMFANDDLLGEAEVLYQNCLERMAMKKRARENFGLIRNKLFLANMAMKGIHGDLQEKRHLVKVNLEDLVLKGEFWFKNMEYDELIEFSENLEKLSETARIRFRDIDVEPAEALLRDIGRYVASINDAEDEMIGLVNTVDNLMQRCGFKINEREIEQDVERLNQCLLDVEDFLEKNNVAYGDVEEGSLQVGQPCSQSPEGKADADDPAGRSGRGFDANVVLALRENLIRAMDALERGPDFFGLNRMDKKEGASCSQILPLYDSIEALVLEDPSCEEESSMRMLVEFSQTIKRYGYSSMGKAFETMKFQKGEEASEIEIDVLASRLEKLGVKDKLLIQRLYCMISPFTFCNFRRLLCSKMVSQELMTGGADRASVVDGADNRLSSTQRGGRSWLRGSSKIKDNPPLSLPPGSPGSPGSPRSSGSPSNRISGSPSNRTSGSPSNRTQGSLSNRTSDSKQVPARITSPQSPTSPQHPSGPPPKERDQESGTGSMKVPVSRRRGLMGSQVLTATTANR